VQQLVAVAVAIAAVHMAPALEEAKQLFRAHWEVLDHGIAGHQLTVFVAASCRLRLGLADRTFEAQCHCAVELGGEMGRRSVAETVAVAHVHIHLVDLHTAPGAAVQAAHEREQIVVVLDSNASDAAVARSHQVEGAFVDGCYPSSFLAWIRCGHPMSRDGHGLRYFSRSGPHALPYSCHPSVCSQRWGKDCLAGSSLACWHPRAVLPSLWPSTLPLHFSSVPLAAASPDETHHLIVAEVAFYLAGLCHPARLSALRGRFLDLAESALELELGGLAVAADDRYVDEAEEVDRETGEDALCTPGRMMVEVSAILIRWKVDGHLCLVVAGIEDHTADLASRDPRKSVQRSFLADSRVHWIAVEVLRLSAVAGLVDHIVDLASRKLLGAHSCSPRSVFRVHSVVVNDLLVCSLAVRNLVVGTLGHTVVPVRRRFQCHRRLRSIGRAAGSYHIHNHHIHHAVGEAGRSPDHKIDHSHRIAAVAAEDSRHSVFAPEPAGAGRSKLDEELRRSLIGRTPCCRSNGRRSGLISRVSQGRPTRRTSLNGFR
jgi:hypothetical protein